jgi:hypothetical protein
VTVDAEYVMSMVELLQHRVQFAAEAFVFAHAEDLGDDVGRQAKHPQLTRALEDLVDRKVATEDEIPTVMCPPQICGRWRERESPVPERILKLTETVAT